MTHIQYLNILKKKSGNATSLTRDKNLEQYLRIIPISTNQFKMSSSSTTTTSSQQIISKNEDQCHICTTDESGSIEVIVKPQSQILGSEYYNNEGIIIPASSSMISSSSTKENDVLQKKKFKNIMKRIKPPKLRGKQRSTSTSSVNRSGRGPLVQINLRKIQSAVSPTPRKKTQGKNRRHSRSSSDFDIYDISHRNNDENDGDNDDEESSSSSSRPMHMPMNDAKNHPVSNGEDVLLVSNCVSEEETILRSRPRSQSSSTLRSFSREFDRVDTLSISSLYNMVTSSWKMDEGQDNHDDHDSKTLVRRESGSTLGVTSSEDHALSSSISMNQTPFFLKEDFDTSTWLEVNATNGISILGAAVMTATVVIHPLMFVAGAATAVWAVGFLHGLEKG